jgi:hypothetical protein
VKVVSLRTHCSVSTTITNPEDPLYTYPGKSTTIKSACFSRVHHSLFPIESVKQTFSSSMHITIGLKSEVLGRSSCKQRLNLRSSNAKIPPQSPEPHSIGHNDPRDHE